MSKMPVEDFVKNCRSYIGRPYSEIDCSKLLHLASGGRIKRGANTQWRSETEEKGRISDGRPSDPYPPGNDRKSSELEIGMAVFMHKNKDTDKYPDGLGDYCHVGVVTSVHPLRICNASSEEEKVTEYTRIGTFCAWAYLSDIDYGAEAEPPQEDETMSESREGVWYTAKVVTTSGGLNVRQDCTIDSSKLGSLKKGTVIEVLDENEDGTWAKINYKGGVGWVSTRYILELETIGPEPGTEDDTMTPDQIREELETEGLDVIEREEFNARFGQLELQVATLTQVVQQMASRIKTLESGMDVGE